MGINTRNLAHDEQGLKNRISETTAQLNRQRDALARVSAQQAKLNAVKQRYQAGKELAGNMVSVGAAGVGIAAAGTMAGVKLLMPGYEFAQKNSELQAVLGVAKDSAEMTALRKQARQLGDNTAASADDAAGAQIIIAKAGGDVDAIQAATPVTLNMALANRRTMEENAALLMGMKSAFQLSNDKVAHIGDVLSMTMNKTAADFDGMSDALTYAAPVAKMPVSALKKPPQWSGRCMMQKSQAQWRDGKPCRVKPPAGTDGKSMGCTQRAWSENLRQQGKHPANIYHSERNAGQF